MSELSLPPPLSSTPTGRGRGAPLKFWMLLLVGALALAVYGNSLTNGFAFDDVAIVKGPHVTNLEWTTIWTDNYWPRTNGILPDSLYRPLTLWSYLANEAIAPGVPWPFHLVNIVLHALVSVLASVLAWRLLGNRWIALVAGGLFAVHPLHVEAVANVVGRAELLAALWSLLAILVFLPARPLPEDTAPMKRPWWHGGLVAVCFLAALLSKETPATLLLALPLLDVWRWWRWPRATRPAWWRWLGGQAVRYYGPMVAVFGVYLALRIPACGLMAGTSVIHHIVNPLVEATPLERVITPFMLLAKYFWLTFWPVHLSSDYSLPSLLPTVNPFYATSFQPPAVAGMLLCALGLIFAIRWRHKAPQLLLLVGLFATSYALVANVIRIGTIFGERLFYWPSVFVLIVLAWGMVEGHARARQAWLARPMRRRMLSGAGLAVLAALVFLMGWRSRIRNTDWSDNLSVAISSARDNPQSGKACAWAGSVLILSDQPEYVEFGRTLLERAVELSPDYVKARWELAKYYGMRHELGQSAIRVAQAARIDPGTHITRVAIPALINEMAAAKPETYMPVIQAYQRDHPEDETAYLALAFAYHAQRQFDQAAVFARKAIDMGKRIRPDGFDQFHEAAAELAAIWFDAGRIEEAVQKFRMYATFLGRSADAHCEFVSMLLKLDPRKNPGALGEAEYNLAIVQELEPDNPQARVLRGELNRIRRDVAGVRTVTANAADSHEGARP